MRGRERKATEPERSAGPAGVLRFSTADLPEAERVAQWREVVGRTLTGCTPSPLADGGLAVDFAAVAGASTRLAVLRLRQVRNHRDPDCLRDGDGDLVFFSMLNGEGQIDHDGRRVTVRRGEACSPASTARSTRAGRGPTSC